jgi:hypothetical protein
MDETVYQCPECNFNADNISELDSHLVEFHSNELSGSQGNNSQLNRSGQPQNGTHHHHHHNNNHHHGGNRSASTRHHSNHHRHHNQDEEDVEEEDFFNEKNGVSYFLS